MPAPQATADRTCPKCGFALKGLTTAICPECGVEFTPALLERARRRQRRRRWLISLAIMAFAMYAPFSWLVWTGYPWGDYHWQWLRMWPILPGLPATILLRAFVRPDWPQWAEEIGMGVLTALLLLLFTWVGTRGRRWLIITAIIVFALSCYNGWVGYALFRM
jgi:hypothetical protein